MMRFLILLTTILILAVAGAVTFVLVDVSQPGPLTESKTVIFERGMGFRAMADKLEQEGVIANALPFKVMAVVSLDARRFKPGEYLFEPGLNALQVMDKLAKGEVVIRKLTVAEGLTASQVNALLMQAEGLTGDGATILREGEFLPETYHFTYGDSRVELAGRMRKAMHDALMPLWEARAQGLPFTKPEEAVTLASIVEKETRLPEERPRVAAVFINRLRRGIKLDADPTVIYAVTKGATVLGRALTYDDLKIDSPYNTYKYAGLPPTPIANPGKASIAAVLQPMQTEELYFVADGKGGHVFAKTIKEHEANVQAWRKLQAKPPAPSPAAPAVPESD